MVRTSKKATFFEHPLIKDLYVDKIPGGTSPLFEQPFVSYFTPLVLHGIIADLGCGKDVNGFLIRLSRYLEGAKIIGIEINKDCIKFCNKYNIYDEIIEKPLPNLSFKNKSIELVLCTEVIEHLTRKDGLKLLEEIDRVCKGRVIITTPNIFFPTQPGDPEDKHWGDKLLKIKQALYYFFTPISYLFPHISGSLIAIKDFN